MSFSLSRIDKIPIALYSSLFQWQEQSAEVKPNNNKYQSEPMRGILNWQRIDPTDNE